ncbi:hypothetical protein KEM52_003639, partial [Ascosphaera acerosa]
MCLLGILKTLEDRATGDVNPLRLWTLVIALGSSMLAFGAVEARVFWCCFSRFAIPIFEELAVVCFAKSLRRKDAKSASKGADNQAADDSLADDNTEADDSQQSRQAVVNLVAIDARRISDSATYVDVIFGTVFELSTALVLLWKLIGLRSLAAGGVVAIVITPLNLYIASKYTSAQTSIMTARDHKMSVITEVLQGIRQVKFAALEEQWQKRIQLMRQKELKALATSYFWDTFLIALWGFFPISLSVVCLGVYSLLHGGLTASVAFTTVSIFKTIESVLANFPEGITMAAEASVSVSRINQHLFSEENERQTLPSDTISFKEATVSWPAESGTPPEQRFTLSGLNFQVPKGGLTVISGKTGSGKSLVLAAIIGEAEVLEGAVHAPVPPPVQDRHDDRANRSNWIIDDAIAYVSQIPWIENATIKDNILFGLPYDSDRYERVLNACALKKDFEQLEDGDLTDIGANGINLSGGQKWRVSFARALYSRAGVLVMDDIFSALDAHTGRHLYEHALTSELGAGRTRILVTHHIALCLPRTDYCVHLVDGTVGHAGTIAELTNAGHLKEVLALEPPEEQEQDQGLRPGEDLDETAGADLQRVQSRKSTSTAAPLPPEATATTRSPKKFQQDEDREVGSIKLVNYTHYMKHGGGYFFWIVIFMVYGAAISLAIARDYSMSIWTRAGTQNGVQQDLQTTASVMQVDPLHGYHLQTAISGNLRTTTSTKSQHGVWFYLIIYASLSFTTCIFGGLKYFVTFRGALQASRSMFDELLTTILRVPMRWLDTVPLGRILNRFTSDFNMLDSRMSYDCAFFLHNVFQVIAISLMGASVSPYMLIFCVVPLVGCTYYSRLFLIGSREIKRLESNAKSPVLEQYGTALVGLQSIRAFGKAQAYMERMFKLVDTHAVAYWHLWLFNRWLHFRVQ